MESVTPPGATICNPALTNRKRFLLPLLISLCSVGLCDSLFCFVSWRRIFSIFLSITTI